MNSPAPIKVTDLVTRSLDELANANRTTGEDAARHERKARIFSDLAGAQSAKTANIIAYLNSDRSTWSEADEEVVRVMLGLHVSGDAPGDGGAAELAPDDAPTDEPSYEIAEPTFA